jgi:hypothetical protein
MLQFLDIFILIFHTILILFNLFGWIFKKTRRLNLITLIITGLSWFVLGIFYGMGYCPLTDWHWSVLHQMGDSPSTDSYIQYLIQRLFNLEFSTKLIDNLTLVLYFGSLAASVYVNFLRRIFKR